MIIISNHCNETLADIRLFGPKAELENLLGADTLKSGRVQVVDAPDVITMHDEPMMAVRRKTASSLVMGLKDVAAQNAQAFVSAGSTGALFLGGMVTLRMLPGISRPALAAVLPGLNAPFYTWPRPCATYTVDNWGYTKSAPSGTPDVCSTRPDSP